MRDNILFLAISFFLILLAGIAIRAWYRAAAEATKGERAIQDVIRSISWTPRRPPDKDADAYDGEAIADFIVYHHYGPGAEELAKAEKEVWAAFQVCGPGWRPREILVRNIPDAHLTEAHNRVLDSLVEAGRLQQRHHPGDSRTSPHWEYRVL